jgi:hypothetical protein
MEIKFKEQDHSLLRLYSIEITDLRTPDDVTNAIKHLESFRDTLFRESAQNVVDDLKKIPESRWSQRVNAMKAAQEERMKSNGNAD